jgi:transcriptional regulator with XRE-family HTH domain
MKVEFDLAKVEELASNGLTQSQIADYFGVSPSTISAHKKDAEFLRALNKGKARGIAVIANALFEKAKGGDTTSMIFFLRSRAGWVEPQRIKQEIEHHGTDPSKMSTDQLNAMIAGMLRDWGDEDAERHVQAFLYYLIKAEKDAAHWIEENC